MAATPKLRPNRRARGLDGRKPIHGTRALERVLNANAADQRTATDRLLRMVEGDLIADAGGEAYLTNRERLLIRRCAAHVVILGAIDAYVCGGRWFVNEDDMAAAAALGVPMPGGAL